MVIAYCLLYALLLFVFLTGPTNHMALCKMSVIISTILWVKVVFIQSKSQWMVGFMDCVSWWIAWAPFVGMFIARISEPFVKWCWVYVSFHSALQDFSFWKHCNLLNSQSKTLGDMVLSDPALSLFKLLEPLIRTLRGLLL